MLERKMIDGIDKKNFYHECNVTNVYRYDLGHGPCDLNITGVYRLDCYIHHSIFPLRLRVSNT
jgi:hypothetical protein